MFPNLLGGTDQSRYPRNGDDLGMLQDPYREVWGYYRAVWALTG